VGQVAQRQAILTPSHDVLRQAVHRPQVGEGNEEAKIVTYKVVKGPNDASLRDARQEYSPGRDLPRSCSAISPGPGKFLGNG